MAGGQAEATHPATAVPIELGGSGPSIQGLEGAGFEAEPQSRAPGVDEATAEEPAAATIGQAESEAVATPATGLPAAASLGVEKPDLQERRLVLMQIPSPRCSGCSPSA